MNDKVKGPPWNPWGDLELKLTRPAFHPAENPPGGTTGFGTWLNGTDILPAVVMVNVTPLVVSRRPCCASHPNRPWASRIVSFTGFGAVCVTGTAQGSEPGRDLLATVCPSVTAMSLIHSDHIPGPGPCSAADPADRIAWMEVRLYKMLGALLAQYVRDSQRPDVNGCGLLLRHADAYTTRQGMVNAHPFSRTTLTDPRTY